MASARRQALPFRRQMGVWLARSNRLLNAEMVQHDTAHIDAEDTIRSNTSL
uniref:Transposase n=1 Tax=Ascaris lumbricoides TaxID=6252 RepID=A0A0M3HUQ3_ASCLU